jgi:hypothetical protein
MNNPIQKISIFLIGILLMTSCQSHAKITKVKVAQEPSQNFSKHFDVHEKQNMTAHDINQNPTENELISPDESTGNTIQITGSKEKSRTSFLETLKQANDTENTSLKSINQASKIKLLKPVPPRSNNAALSLIWIVILVLIILWILGLISGGWGMGAFINVLLVIALILLILWLLRII